MVRAGIGAAELRTGSFGMGIQSTALHLRLQITILRPVHGPALGMVSLATSTSSSGVEPLAEAPGETVDKDCEHNDTQSRFHSPAYLQARNRANDLITKATGTNH
jgi:hypothetical protein